MVDKHRIRNSKEKAPLSLKLAFSLVIIIILLTWITNFNRHYYGKSSISRINKSTR